MYRASLGPEERPDFDAQPIEERRNLLALRVFGRALVERDTRRSYFALTHAEQHAVTRARVRVRDRVSVSCFAAP